MEPSVTKAIQARLRGGEHIVFTGHSAGGGVAALLFIHYLAQKTFGGQYMHAHAANSRCLKHANTPSDTKISCLTFAAPPIVSRTQTPVTIPETSTFLSCINENDPVPRADKTYIMSFAELYATYKTRAETLSSWLPPVPKLHIPEESTLVVLRPKQVSDQLEVGLHELGVEQFEKTLALDAEAHKMDWYLEELRAWDRGSSAMAHG